MIRRFAAQEDQMLRASLNYGFQKSVRLEELGPDKFDIIVPPLSIAEPQLAGALDLLEEALAAAS